MRVLVLSAFSLLVLLGCAKQPPAMPVPRNAPWSTTSPSLPVKEQPAQKTAKSSGLTLQECIETALANNFELAASKSDADVSAAQHDGAQAGLWPKVALVGNYTHSMDELRLAQATYNGEPGVFAKDISSGELAITFPLYTGGRITSDISAAELLKKASEHKLAFTREELVYNISSLYFGIIAQRHVIDSLVFSQNVLNEEKKRITQLLNTQKAAQVDLLKADVRLADIEQKLTQEKNTLAITQRVLVNLMGTEGTDPATVVAGELILPGQTMDLSPYTVTQALKNRQDYLAAQAAFEAQQEKVSGVKSGYLPTVSMKGAYGRKFALDPTRDEKWASNNDTSAEYASVGLVFELPLFEGGLTNAKVREENAKLSSLQFRLRKLEKQIELDMETALLNTESARSRISSSSVGVKQAKESLRIERMKYELGKGVITDTLDAQAALLLAQVNYYRALAEYHTALAKLRFMTGGAS